MANKYLDYNGLLYFWGKIKAKLADKSDKTETITNITRSGTTFTATRADNSTFTFTQQDNTVAKTTTTPKANGTAAIGTETKYAAGDHVHPSQTTISGNAGTATTLQTARNLDGISFNGSANIHHFAICETAAATGDKIATVEDSMTFTLAKGAIVFVKFTYSNTATSPSLNVNNTGLKAIKRYGTTAPGTTTESSWNVGSVVGFMYDGSYWQMIGFLNSTYTNASFGIGYGTTSTGSSTITKAVTLSNYAKRAGGIVAIKFTNAVTTSTLSLNINSTGAVDVSYKGSTTFPTNLIKAGDIAYFVMRTTSAFDFLGVDNRASATTPKAPGTASVGTEECYSRGDHVHPAQNTYTSIYTPTDTADTYASQSASSSTESFYFLEGDNIKIRKVSTNSPQGLTISNTYQYYHYYGVCSTAASIGDEGTPAKTVTISNEDGNGNTVPFSTAAGTIFTIKFSNDALSWGAPTGTLNINGLGAVGVSLYNGGAADIYAGDIVTFIQTASAYAIISINRHGGNYNRVKVGSEYMTANMGAGVDAPGVLELAEGTHIDLGLSDGNRLLTIGFTGKIGSSELVDNVYLGQAYGSSNSSTSASQTASITNYALRTGGIVAIKFTNDVPASSTLNISVTGAKSIYHKGSAIAAGVIKAGNTATFMYDGTRYQLLAVDSSVSVATTSSNGLMSSSDKTKLNKLVFSGSVIDSSILPSFVDDVIEVWPITGKTELAADWLADNNGGTTPITPEVGKIYVLMADTTSYSTNSQFRWGGSGYVKMNDGGVSSITNAEIDTICET